MSEDERKAPVLDGDELAGIVELFGALDREELHRAASELLYRHGHDPDERSIEPMIDDALDQFELVRAPGAVEPAPDGAPLVAGPTAFPAAPEHAGDLPHILDVDRREVDRKTAGEAVQQRYVAAVQTTLEAENTERAEQLLDLGYDIEAWAPVEVGTAREQLDGLLDD